MSGLVIVAWATFDPPTHSLLLYSNDSPQQMNIKTAFNQLGWPHTDFLEYYYGDFWVALNNGTDWNFVCIDSTHITLGGDFTQLTTYGTNHPNCRIIYYSWMGSWQTDIWSYFGVTGITNIQNTIPPAYVWNSSSPIWSYAGLPGPPEGINNPGLTVVGNRLSWNTADTTDVPLGWSSTSAQGQGAWVFSRRQGSESWRRPRSAWLGFPMSGDPTNGVAYYKGILQYMCCEGSDPKVAAQSVGNVKALYR